MDDHPPKKLRTRRVPGREWTWNENALGCEGVHTFEGRLTWYSFKGNPHSGGAAVSQSYKSFLEKGPNSSAPASIVREVREYLLVHLPEYRHPASGQGPADPLLRPAGQAIQVFDWNEGYDGEYEFRATVYRNCIEWHLEFDPQWSDPPQTELQSLEDYLKNGAPGIFDRPASYYDIKDLARKLYDSSRHEGQ